MSQTVPIDTIRKRHEELYEKVIESQGPLTKAGGQREVLLRDVDELLTNIVAASADVTSIEDYRWLSDTAVKWQVVFSSLMNRPKTVRIKPPPQGLLPVQAPGQALTEDELNYWLETHEKYFECYRQAKLGRWSTDRERDEDRRLARVFLASDVLDGKTNFALRIASGTFWRLEDEWLEDLKHLRAYLLWLERSGGIDPVTQENDYAQACEHLRSMLVNPGIKARPAQFGEAKAYLGSRYLRRGRLDLGKGDTYQLISRKAHRLYEQTGQADAAGNWRRAEAYTRMFYENIIPAVMDDDLESARAVLKAMQSAQAAQTYHVINCFEATLVTYFLRLATVHALWEEGREHPGLPSSVRTAVAVPSWPDGFIAPPACGKDFEVSGRQIAFWGVMSSEQKDALVAAAGERQRPAIEQLFTESRLVSRQTTF